jgi:hypothetical protein
MITPTSGQMVVAPAAPEKIADGIWISSIQINSPSPLKPITAMIRMTPFNSTNGEVYPQRGKVINLRDVQQEFSSYPSLESAMGAIIVAVNDLVSGKQLF